jgi:hypothetical protein
MIKLLLTLLSTLFLSSAIAWDQASSGRVWWSELPRMALPLEEKTEAQGGLFFQHKSSFNEKWRLQAELIGFYIQSSLLEAPEKDLKRGDFFTEINELNLRYQLSGLTIKAGQQTTSWGKSDGLNPTDFLSGRRNILLGAEDLETRRGHLSTMVEWIPNAGDSPWNLQQWVVINHATTDVLLNSKLTQGVVELEEEKKNPSPELATKVSYQGSGFEAEYIYFQGVNKTPLFREKARSLFPLKLTLEPHYVRQEAHGLNVVKDMEESVLRLEAAFVRRLDIEAHDYIKTPNRLDVVIGMEKSFFTNHRVNMQLVGHHYPDYKENFTTDQLFQQVKLFNRTLQAQHQQTRLGYLLTYQFEPLEMNQWKVHLSWLNYLYQESASVLSPEVEYELSSGLRAKAFALLFNGEQRTPFGVLHQLSSLGASLAYQF